MENDGGLDVRVVQAEHDALQLFQSEADELPPAASTPIPPAPSTPIPPVATWRHAYLSQGSGRRITFGFGCGVLIGALMMQSLATPRADTRPTSRPPAMPAPAPAQTVAAPVATTLAAETVKADAAPQPPRTSPVAEPAAVPGYRGEFRITSNPSGAAVFVNNERVGHTPFASSALRVGSRAVRLELDGHVAWSRSVQIVANRVASVSAQLEVARRQEADETLPDLTQTPHLP